MKQTSRKEKDTKIGQNEKKKNFKVSMNLTKILFRTCLTKIRRRKYKLYFWEYF
jgi:hypothetical protein